MANESINRSVDENARRRFEMAWQGGGPASIEQYLPAPQNPAFVATLEEFVHIDLEFSWKSGTYEPAVAPRVEAYLARFPQLRATDVVLRLLRQEYRVRHRYGDRPSLTEYAARFPDLSDAPGNLAGISMAEAASPGSVPPVQESGAWSAAPAITGYEISDRLGEGAMGVVWKAMQLSTRRVVALKLTSAAGMGSERARLRFQREVELTARLEHPHIARVYDGGQTNGICFYAMEYVQGPPLDQYVKEAALSRPAIVELMKSVCAAVHYAHQKGVIHRDLKPANIMVTADAQPHVLDFGLAKAMEHESGTTLTLEGAIAGTPAYMSPEQAGGHMEKLDARSDVYSLGVILFHLLTGKFPHDTTGSIVNVMRRIAEQEAVRLRHLEPRADRELEAILSMALARQPERRYASAGRFADDLDRYLTGQPLEARLPTLRYVLRKRLGRHPVLASIAALALVIGLGTGTAWYIHRVHGTTRQSRGTAPAVAAAPVSHLLLQDDFTSPLPRPTPLFGEGAMSLKNINAIGQLTCHATGIQPAMYDGPVMKDFVADVDIHNVVPDEHSSYGLVFRSTSSRYKPDINYYIVIIVPDDNKAVLGCWKDSEWVLFDYHTLEPQVLHPTNPNHLRVEAIGHRFRAWINDTPILDREDKRLEEAGVFGLCMGGSDLAVGEFQNLRVTEPPKDSNSPD